MKIKQFTIESKAIDAAGEGRFTGYASVFGNIDLAGDMVIPGAFEESLKDFSPDGAGIPLLWRHRTDDPFMNLGATVGAKEDEHGLWVDCQIDLETANGKQSHKLLKQKRVGQMSFAYDVLEGAWVDRKPEEGGSYYELRKLAIREVSIVQFGANGETAILTVKAAVDSRNASVKAGVPLTAAEESDARAAKTALEELLTTDPEPAPADSAKDDDEHGEKSSESAGLITRARALNTLIQSL